ncbi:MAG: zinc dependent phospholipase C family protein [Tissierellia bacterium]|nr:zinc dependent phospholipase C family protein [Bacillota bacterium]NLL22358.1 zinc dependent phospholipase C family protein [Tissierellia bacterium]
MPDLWTHYFFSKDVQKDNHLPISWESLYSLGAQGPDFLFYLDFQPWKKKSGFRFGTLMHQEKPKELMSYVLTLLEKADDILRDYLLGFVAHYALDSTAHPFVFYYAQDPIEHKVLEASIDALLFEERMARPLRGEDSLAIIDVGKQLPQQVVDFYRKAAKDIYDEVLPERVIQSAYRDFREFLILTRPKGFIRLSLQNLIEKLGSAPVSQYIYPETVDPKVLNTNMYEDFMQSYDKGRHKFTRLFEVGPECAMRNFEGDLSE